MKTAVIGGGFSGLLTAYLLEKRGIDVTVFEKEDRIGGHCHTMNSNGLQWELGTVAAFSKRIKPLLIELKIGYAEKYPSRNFLDKDFSNVPLVHPSHIDVLQEALKRFKRLYNGYEQYLKPHSYGPVPEDLTLPLSTFLERHGLQILSPLMASHLSSYGFGSMDKTQAYYAIKSLSGDTLETFIHGDQLLFINGGTSELIRHLSQRIRDIRYAQPVHRVKIIDSQVQMTTSMTTEIFDRVYITAKLKDGVLTDDPYRRWMSQIQTNPYFTCVYEIRDRHAVTTYFKANLGIAGKIQFFYSTRQNGRAILVAYAYGIMTKELIESITDDLQRSGIHVDHLITAKQWHIFPHINMMSLSDNPYKAMTADPGPIHFTGTLICHPSLTELYQSIAWQLADKDLSHNQQHQHDEG